VERIGEAIEALRAESGGGPVLGEEQLAPPLQIGGLRDRCLSSLSGVRGGASFATSTPKSESAAI